MRKHTFTIPGKVFFDFLDPALETESALEMAPYYSGRQINGTGTIHWYIDVPEDELLAMLDDLDNVAYCRIAGDPEDRASRDVGYKMRKVSERLRRLVDDG